MSKKYILYASIEIKIKKMWYKKQSDTRYYFIWVKKKDTKEELLSGIDFLGFLRLVHTNKN